MKKLYDRIYNNTEENEEIVRTPTRKEATDKISKSDYLSKTVRISNNNIFNQVSSTDHEDKVY